MCSDVSEDESIPPLFEDEYDLFDPIEPSDPSAPIPDASAPDSSFPPPTVSVACCRQDLICIVVNKRSRKPLTPRRKRPTSAEQLDEFLSRGCRCASNCYVLFNRDHYQLKRDEASSLYREELDMVVLGQIQAFLCIDDVVSTP